MFCSHFGAFSTDFHFSLPLPRQLCDEGAEDRILVAHDIHTKHRLEEFGGHGFSHILTTAAPKMLKVKGVTQAQVDKILVDNPAKALAYCPPK